MDIWYLFLQVSVGKPGRHVVGVSSSGHRQLLEEEEEEKKKKKMIVGREGI